MTVPPFESGDLAFRPPLVARVACMYAPTMPASTTTPRGTPTPMPIFPPFDKPPVEALSEVVIGSAVADVERDGDDRLIDGGGAGDVLDEEVLISTLAIFGEGRPTAMLRSSTLTTYLDVLVAYAGARNASTDWASEFSSVYHAGVPVMDWLLIASGLVMARLSILAGSAVSSRFACEASSDGDACLLRASPRLLAICSKNNVTEMRRIIAFMPMIFTPPAKLKTWS